MRRIEAAECGAGGPDGRNRTCDMRFWRPLLCLAELRPTGRTKIQSYFPCPWLALYSAEPGHMPVARWMMLAQ